MESLHDYVLEYQRQLNRGAIQKAYRGLMEYIMALRRHFAEKYPDHAVSGSIYYGYMDMTYFALAPKALRDRKLKVAIVFIHEGCRFEAWLAGANKEVQAKYWKLFKESGWNKYRVVPTTKGADSIVESVLVEDPAFRDLDALTKQIERAARKFMKDVEAFLVDH